MLLRPSPCRRWKSVRLTHEQYTAAAMQVERGEGYLEPRAAREPEGSLPALAASGNKYGAEPTVVGGHTLRPGRPRRDRSHGAQGPRNLQEDREDLQIQVGSTCCLPRARERPWITSLTSVYTRDGSQGWSEDVQSGPTKATRGVRAVLKRKMMLFIGTRR